MTPLGCVLLLGLNLALLLDQTHGVGSRADTAVLVADRSCPSSWQEFESNCYLVVENYWTWDEAEKDCSLKGGHLASIHSAAERSFINNLLPSNHLWIGGTEAAVNFQSHLIYNVRAQYCCRIAVSYLMYFDLISYYFNNKHPFSVMSR